jgi:UDP-N-acetylglucosamine:LPS N-acetylglucosamine transferase
MAVTANEDTRQDPTMRPARVLAIASGGGHWVQLLRLRPAFAGERVAFVTVKRTYRADVGDAPFYVVNDATRWNKLGLLRLALRMTWIVLRERPDVIVTTGAAPGYFGVLIGKLFGARTAWIDSMANVERLSLSGQKVGRWADLWLTQWPELASEGGPRFQGAVI